MANKKPTLGTPSVGFLFLPYAPGGDGGNRTRVRKIRSADLYERSRLL